MSNYSWTDNPTVSGVSICDTDILNENLMHLKYIGATTLANSGTIALSDNTVNSITATGTVTFSLPNISDAEQFHQIVVLLYMSSAVTINLGTSYYFGRLAPDMSEAGYYTIIYEYDGSHWVVGALNKGTAV